MNKEVFTLDPGHTVAISTGILCSRTVGDERENILYKQNNFFAVLVSAVDVDR